MIKLPFYVENPWAPAVFCFVMAAVIGGLWWAYVADVSVGRALKWYFHRRFRVGGEIHAVRAEAAGWYLLALLTVTFATLAIFALSVGVGLIQDGDPPRVLSPEEFFQQQGS